MTANFNRYRAHPWHGLPIGDQVPDLVESYIEITPFDAVKYEIDKRTGYLRVDRPQGSSALPPTLYGEADDKIVALLASDTVFDYAKDLKNLPAAVVNRMVHYFATYKMDISGQTENKIEVVGTYGADHARQVIMASIEDYNEAYGVEERRGSL